MKIKLFEEFVAKVENAGPGRALPEEGDTLAELNDMTLGQLERIGDYAQMIADRMEGGQGLESWMFSEITQALNGLNSVHDAMDGNDGVKEKVKESAMADIDLMAQEAKDFKAFVKEFTKKYHDLSKAGESGQFESWLKSIYDSAKESMEESIEAVDEATLNIKPFEEFLSEDRIVEGTPEREAARLKKIAEGKKSVTQLLNNFSKVISKETDPEKIEEAFDALETLVIGYVDTIKTAP